MSVSKEKTLFKKIMPVQTDSNTLSVRNKLVDADDVYIIIAKITS